MTERLFTQSELNAIVAQERRRIEAKYEGFKTKAEQFEQLLATADDSGDTAAEASTEVDSPEDAAPELDAPVDDPAPDSAPTEPQNDLQSENALLRTQLLRQQISAKQGLDPDLWDRVTGGTADEIAVDVSKLKRFVPPRPRPPLGNLKSGAGAPPDYRSPKEKAAAALRAMRT